ncbi:MAG: substrate binding domain-containing protein [Hyphomicrobiales bacterium]
MPVWISNSAFAEILSAYHQRFHQVVFDFDLSGRKINIIEEGVDLALRVAFTLDEGLIARRLGEVTFQMVASPIFLNNVGRPKKITDLTNAPMLAYSHVAADGRIKFGGKNGEDVKLRPVMVSDNETILHLAAIAGMGFAILPNWAVQNDLADGKLKLVLPQVKWPTLKIQAIYADRSYLPAKVRTFLDFLAGPEGLTPALRQVDKPKKP